MIFMCLLCIFVAGSPITANAQNAEDVFKNVQVLKGIPVDQFMDTMGYFSASLGLNCTSCHGVAAASDPARFADDPALKKTARRMILMVNAINKEHFAGAKMISCYSCHRGGDRPKIIPSLKDLYGTPDEDPNEFEVTSQSASNVSADQVFEKYIQALGGSQAVGRMTSFVGKGTYDGYDTDREKVPVEVFAKAPDQHTTIIHIRGGDKIETYDGHAGWVREPATPAPFITLTAGDLDGAKVDASVFFPPRVRQSRSQWRVGGTMIEDTDVLVVQGTATGQTPIKLYFDQKTGLLVRMVRYTNTMVGPIATQMDYSDYRTVAGVKMPFKWITTWVSGQSTTQLSEVQANVAIDASRFAKPVP